MRFSLRGSVVIWILILFLLWLGPGTIFNHQLDHGRPFAFSASDAYQHQIRMEFIQDQDHYKTEAAYTQGGEEDVLGYYQPILFHLAVLFSNLTNIEVYQAGYLLLFVFAILAAVLMYDLLQQWNKTVALLSLPFMVFIFAPGTLTGFTWGHWPAMLAGAFMIALAWSLPKLTEKYGWLYTGVFMAALAMTHGSEFVYAIFLCGLYGLWYVWQNKSKNKRLFFTIQFVKAALLALILSSYSLIILYNVWMKGYSFSFSAITEFPGFGIVISPHSFDILGWVMLVGIVLAIITWRQKTPWTVLFGLAYLAFGYSNYIGFDWRAVTQRFYWPITLAVFFGVTLYIILKASKQIKLALPLAFVLLIVSAFFVGARSIPGSMDAAHWEMFNAIATDTPPDSSILFLYGDLYSQDAMLRNSKRYHNIVVTQDYAEKLNNQEVSRYYELKKPADWSGFAYWEGFATINHRNEEFWPTKFTEQDICQFDYFVADKIALSGQTQPLINYNQVVINVLVQTPWITPVFENQVAIILHNSKPGADCLQPEGLNETG